MKLMTVAKYLIGYPVAIALWTIILPSLALIVAVGTAVREIGDFLERRLL